MTISKAIENNQIRVAKGLAKQYIENQSKDMFYSILRKEYNELYPTHRDMTKEEFYEYQDSLELLPEDTEVYEALEEIPQIPLEPEVSYEEWLGETVVVSEAVEEVLGENGEVVTPYQAEVVESVRPYEPIEVTDEMVQEYLEKLPAYSEYNETKKTQTLDRMTVEVNGKVFYADPVSRADISDAVAIAEDSGQANTVWKLAEELDGSKYASVTLDELKEARAKALEKKGELVGAV